jgi:ribonucleoside-diphosphate reductase alpha chain
MSDIRPFPNAPTTSPDADPTGEVPLQETSRDIWQQKYCLRDQDGAAVDRDIDATYQRVARAIAGVELTADLQNEWHEKFLWALRQGAIPAGRILSNAGAGAHKADTSTINCTVSGTLSDSMESILTKNTEAGLTLKAGCGIGYEFSTLRPSGARVAGAGARTSGPLSFMDIFDKTCLTVSSAGGRRGAQMATFDISHPDVLDFIRAKREPGRLRQFNLSLLITDEFMQAVQADASWPLVFPIKAASLAEAEAGAGEKGILWRPWPSDDGYLCNDRGETACRIYREIPARHIWQTIMASTYDFAEPGFILIDRVNEMNNNWFCESIRATNPCVTASTWIHTRGGPRQVRELIGESFIARIDGSDHASGVEGFFKTAAKPVLELRTAEGYQLRLTADHRIRKVSRFTRYNTETQWCPASQLQAGDRVLLNDHRRDCCWQGPYTREQGYLLGLLVGDGTLKADKAVLSVWKPAAVANGSEPTLPAGIEAVMTEAFNAARTMPHRADFKGWSEVSGRNEYRLSLAAIKHLAEDLDMRPGEKAITPLLEHASSDCYRGFLRGLFDADGSVQGSQKKGISVRLAQSDLPCLQTVQRMLLRLGVASKLYLNRRTGGPRLLPNGKGGYAQYTTRAQHELVISGENLFQFQELIDFADTDKAQRLKTLLGKYQRAPNRERFVARVTAVVPDGIEDVYDVKIPGINSFDANGLHAHNCGEQPLPPYGSCLLGSINLTRFVTQPFSENADFNWDLYKQVVAVFTRMLDNVVEINGLPLAEQREEITGKRRHGMGFLGLGSALAMLRLKYGSAHAVQFTERAARELALTGWRTGLELAEEKGVAPVLAREYTITEAMLAMRPEMREHGFKAGNTVPGRVLHARYSRYMQKIASVDPELVEQLAERGCRFSHHSSIAPTGTIALSLANNASNGIEPTFAQQYSRNIIREGRKSKEKVEVDSFELLAYRHLVDPDASPFITEGPHSLPPYFITTDDITPQQHVDMQAAAQDWVDSSISKTINVPSDIDYEAFKDIYLYAYQKGLKGCTTFRFNPDAFQGVLVRDEDIAGTRYRFTLSDGSSVEVSGNEEIEYDGEIHTAANLYDALKEGYYGKL